MSRKLEFIAIVKTHNNIAEIKLKKMLLSHDLTETRISKNQIKVLTFQGSYLDLYATKSWLESEIMSKYLTLIDIGLAPKFKIETIAEPELVTVRNYQPLLQKLPKNLNTL